MQLSQKGSLLFAALIAGMLAIPLSACSGYTNHSQDTRSIAARLQDARLSTEWLMYGHDYGNSRFSTLSQVNTSNVSRLVPAYVFQTGVLGSFEATPIVSGGVMYVTTAYDGVFSVDARTGDQIWGRAPLKGRFRVCCGPVNRGAAIADGVLFVGQLDGVLVALDITSGNVKWATTVADNAAGYSITMAPLVYKDSVLIGVAGGEFGIRGSLSAYSLRDGKLRWRWYSTDPVHWFGSASRLRSDQGLLDPATSEKQRKKYANSWKRGGGGIWTTPAIDSATDTIYVTTGNPWPDTDGSRRPGDNLFTDCIVALDATTGRLKWYFQQTPHDTRDLDAASPPMLFETLDNDGRKVHAVGEVGKTGLYYILDRRNGKLIRQSQDLASMSAGAHGAGWEGGAAWSPVSLDTGLGYVITTAAQHLAPEITSGGAKTGGSSMHNAGWKTGYGTVSAVDISTGRIVWQDKFDQGIVGGSVSTAGGLTFVGEGNGYFDALETKTGIRLWHFQTGAGVNAAPIVFEVDGEEYVAVASGGNHQFGTPFGDAVFVFRLSN